MDGITLRLVIMLLGILKEIADQMALRLGKAISALQRFSRGGDVAHRSRIPRRSLGSILSAQYMHSTFVHPRLCIVFLPGLISNLASRQGHFPHLDTPIRTPAHHPPLTFPIRLATRIDISLPSGKPRYDRSTHRGSPGHMHVP